MAERWERLNETDTALIVSNITAMNGGNYTCVVSNTAGNDSATAVLYVEPIIVTQPTDILARNGTVVSFTCAAESFPAPEYTCYRCVASLPGTSRNATSNQAVLTGIFCVFPCCYTVC